MGISISSSDIIRVLEKFGFQFISQKGSHIKYGKVAIDGVKIVIVPHPRKDIPIGTFQSICRQAGMRKKEFLES